MNEQMKKFLEEAAKDKELQAELTKVTNQHFAEIAKRRGYDLKPEDFDVDAGRELSPDELAAVAGGEEDYCWHGSNAFSCVHCILVGVF
jgi:predicted ribosomally synthesized peptide with nif11-like leader